MRSPSCSARESSSRARVLRRRPRRGPVPARCLPLQALEHRDRDRALRRGARARRGLGLPCDLLRADILGWRSRCHRRQRDYEAAREDVERALELAQAIDDRRAIANTYFQASLVAERRGTGCSPELRQRAKALYEELNDERNVGRLLLNLGGLTLLLGQARRGDRASQGVLRDRRSRRTRAPTPRRRSAARHRPPAPSATNEAGRRARRARRSSSCRVGRLPPRDRPVATRPGASLMERGGSRRRRSASGLRTPLRAAGLAQPSSGGVGRAGRPRVASWGRPRGRSPVPERCRSAPGRPLLRERGGRHEARLLLFS